MNGGLDISRIKSGLFRRLQRPIDLIYSQRHPGPVARRLIKLSAPIVRHMVPNDKWSLGVHVPYWMRAVNAAPERMSQRPKRIFQLAGYRGEFSLQLSLAALLAAHGHKITIGYLPKLGSPIKPPLVDHPSAKEYLDNVFGEIGTVTDGRVKLVDLVAFAGDCHVPQDEQAIEKQARADAIIRLGVETIDLAVPEYRDAIAYYRALGKRTHAIAHNYFAACAGELDLALIANGMTFEGAQFVRAAQAYGVDLVTFEKFAFAHTRVVTHGGAVFSFRNLDRLWAMRSVLGMESEPFRSMAIGRARCLLEERRRASTRNWAWKYQFAPDQSDEDALSAVGVLARRPFALICTNVPFDAGYYQFTTLFPTMRDWLIETVRLVLDKTDLDVVVRVHPGEALHYAGRERSEDNLAAAGLTGHPRLKVVGPRAHVNSYPLMANCHLGIVFSSTTGIEMAMMGRPVIVAADVYYAKRGFTLDCASRDEYFGRLMSARHAPPSPHSDETADKAALFYYVVHFVLQQHYAYDKGIDLQRRPPHRLVASTEMDRVRPFLETITSHSRELDDVFRTHFAAKAPAVTETT